MNVKCPRCETRIPIIVPAEPWMRLTVEGECPKCGRVVNVAVCVEDTKQVGPTETKGVRCPG